MAFCQRCRNKIIADFSWMGSLSKLFFVILFVINPFYRGCGEPCDQFQPFFLIRIIISCTFGCALFYVVRAIASSMRLFSDYFFFFSFSRLAIVGPGEDHEPVFCRTLFALGILLYTTYVLFLSAKFKAAVQLMQAQAQRRLSGS